MTSFIFTLVRFFRGLRRAWQQPDFRMTLIIAIILLVSGTLFYSAVEGWRTLDAMYFCVMTLTTIGYGELQPVRDISKVFTMFYAIVGIGIFVALITQIAQAQIRKNKE